MPGAVRETAPVKGLSRRVVVVRPEEEEALFEQIIYIVRDDALTQPGVSAAEVLRQAEEAVCPPQAPESPPPAPHRDFVDAALPWLSAVALALAAAIGVYWYFLF